MTKIKFIDTSKVPFHGHLNAFKFEYKEEDTSVYTYEFVNGIITGCYKCISTKKY